MQKETGWSLASERARSIPPPRKRAVSISTHPFFLSNPNRCSDLMRKNGEMEASFSASAGNRAECARFDVASGSRAAVETCGILTAPHPLKPSPGGGSLGAREMCCALLKPPLCKGRWHGEAVTEGLIRCAAPARETCCDTSSDGNPSVSLEADSSLCTREPKRGKPFRGATRALSSGEWMRPAPHKKR